MRKDGHVKARRYLHRLSERISHIKILRKGWLAGNLAKQNGEHVIARILLPGDLVGGGVMLQGRPFFAMQALSDVDYCAFPLPDFVQVAESDPGLMQALHLYTADAFKTHQNRIYDAGSREADERILSLVIELYNRAERRGLAQDGAMFFPLRQHQLAKATGMTQVHVSRVLKRLREEGIVTLDRQTLSIADVEKARFLVG